MNKQSYTVLILMLISLNQHAFSYAETMDKKENKSIGKYLSNEAIKEKSYEPKKSNLDEKNTLKYVGLTRELVQSSRSEQLSKKSAQALRTSNEANSFEIKKNASFYSFSIFSAESELLDDIDGDGFYQTFGVIFDADISTSSNNDSALVYADMYLSKDGGPWELYFTTNNFSIFGDSENDAFEVVTNLQSGYAPDHYDVLIDLYEVGYADIVATYSSNNTNALYALPIESSDYDPEYVDVEYYDKHSGASYGIFLLSFIILMKRRKLEKNQMS